MALNIIDRSSGTHHLDQRLTVTAHTLIARDRQPGRPTVLQAELVHTPLEKNRVARVSVLADDFTWTVLLNLPASEWPASLRSGEFLAVYEGADAFAETLLHRAEAILDPMGTI